MWLIQPLWDFSAGMGLWTRFWAFCGGCKPCHIMYLSQQLQKEGPVTRRLQLLLARKRWVSRPSASHSNPQTTIAIKHTQADILTRHLLPPLRICPAGKAQR